MKIIVTGGAGFLGKHLCRALASAGYQVKVIDHHLNPEFETIQADVRDLDAMNEHIKDAEAVFHLAASIEVGESVEDPQSFVDNNITGSLNVLEAMRRNGLKTFIFSSTAAIYGDPTTIPITEDSRTIPINPYGATKLAMEGLLASYVKIHQFNGVALRYFNLYGPEEHHQPETHAVPRFIDQIKKGEEVTVWGDGSPKRDYIFIADVVEAHLKALELVKKEPATYHYLNLSTEQATSVLELINKIAEIMGKEPNIKHFPPRLGDPAVLVADASKAKDKLGWQARTSLEEGLAQTINYFEQRS